PPINLSGRVSERVATISPARSHYCASSHDPGRRSIAQTRCRRYCDLTHSLSLNNRGRVETGTEACAQTIDLAIASGDETRMGRAWSAAGNGDNLTGNHRAAISYL